MGDRGPKPSTSDYHKRSGSIEMHKGQTEEGIPVVAWDAIITCVDEDCPIHTVCPYTRSGKCKVRREYISYVYKILMGQVDKDDSVAHFRIGMELVPLFLQLIDIKIYSYGSLVSYISPKGDLKVNPLMREMRSCIRSISDTIRALEDSFSPDGKRKGLKGADSLIGDTEYYDALFHGEPVEEEFKMRNRV